MINGDLEITNLIRAGMIVITFLMVNVTIVSSQNLIRGFKDDEVLKLPN